jgi:hypothetical protein
MLERRYKGLAKYKVAYGWALILPCIFYSYESTGFPFRLRHVTKVFHLGLCHLSKNLLIDKGYSLLNPH